MQGLLSDLDIIEMVAKNNAIEPFVNHQVKEVNGKRIVSYGCGSAGYDIRASNEWKKPCDNMILDPLESHESQWNSFTQNEPFVLEPGEFILTRSIEHFDIPEDVIAIAVGKSTYARVSVLCNITPLEPSWRGFLTIEISNSGHCPAIIYPNQGISQLLFFRLENKPSVTYKSKGGKYMDQVGIVLAK